MQLRIEEGAGATGIGRQNEGSTEAAVERVLLRVEEVAKVTGISRSKIYEMIAAGELPSVRLGPRSTRIPKAGLTAWILAKTRGGAIRVS